MTDNPTRTTNATNAVLEKGRVRDEERYFELIGTRYLYDFLRYKDTKTKNWSSSSALHWSQPA